jgi:hypothetical protein
MGRKVETEGKSASAFIRAVHMRLPVIRPSNCKEDLVFTREGKRHGPARFKRSRAHYWAI